MRALTTVAYRDGVLAADTRCTKVGVVVGSMSKIARAPDGTLGSGAGGAAFCRAFRDWVIGGMAGEPPERKESPEIFDRGILFRGRQVTVYEPDGWFVHEADYYAHGSGSDFALGAMSHGATAEEAVAAAIAHDPNSGGPIEILRVEETRDAELDG